MRKLFTQLFAVTFLLLLGTWTTAFGQTITSTPTGGLWSATSTWNGGVVPVAANDVVIADGATVTIDQPSASAATVASLTIGQGTSGTLLFDRTTGRALTVTGNVTVNPGGSFLSTDFTAFTPTGDLTLSSLTIANVSSTAGIVAGMSVAGNNYQMTGATVASVTSNTIVLAAGAPTIAGTGVPLTIQIPAIAQALTIGGNLINNGTFDMSKATSTTNSSTTVCNVTFNNTTGDQTISGSTPLLTRFQGVTLTKGVIGNKVVSTIDTYIGGSSFTLTAGTWNQHAGNLINANGSKTLATATGKLLIDGTAGYSNYVGSNYQLPQYTSGSLAVTGSTFEVNTTGKVQIGVGNNSITCTTPGVINLISGNVYVYGKITLTTGTATISGANVYTNPNPSATSGTYVNSALLTSASPLSSGSNPFEVSGAGTFNFTSGTVTLVNPIYSPNTAGNGRDLKITSTGSVNITNGVFYIGDGVSTATSGSTTYNGFMNGSSLAIPNLVIQSGGITGRNFGLKTNLIVGKLTMISGAVEQVASAGTVTYSTGGTLTYNGTAAQTTSGVEFPTTGAPVNLIINNAAGVSLGAAGTVSGALTLTSGNLSTGANTLTLNGTTSGTGLIDTGTLGTVVYGGTVAQTISNLKNNSVNNLTISNTAGVTPGAAITVTGATTVNPGAILKTGAFTFTNNGAAGINGSFQIDDGGWATGTSDFVYGPASTLIFNNTSGSYGVASDARYWPYTSGPQNVTIGTGGVTLNAWRSVNGLIQTSGGITITTGEKLTVNGQLQINSGGFVGNISPEYGAASSLIYNIGSGGYSSYLEWPSTLPPFNVSILNATPVTLTASRSIAGTLALTSGKVTLGANNLTVASTGSITGAGATNYIVTNGAGTLTQTIGAGGTATFPVGASSTSYDPATLTPTSATDVAVNVGTTLPAVAPSHYNYNAKAWNITPTGPSSTIVTLTPSAAVTTIAGDVIGQYISGNYVNTAATKSSNSYTGTFSTFAPFVTGTTDLGTSVSQTRIAGVYFDGQIIHNDANLNLQVYDATGRMMVSSVRNINMSSSPKGVYVVKSTSGSLKIVL